MRQEITRQPTDKSGTTRGGWETRDRGRGTGGQEATARRESEAPGISYEEVRVLFHLFGGDRCK